jgi:hypothetical protein
MSLKAKATILEWEDAITSIPGVTGIARGGHSPEKIYVFVEKKTPQILTALPKHLNEIPVEIIETGKIRILSQQILEVSRTMRMRPLIGGISVSAPEISAGTLSCKVYDRTTGVAYGLSNCHVFGGNWGTKRDGYRTKPIVSPGTIDGGKLPNDKIGSLYRWVDVDIDKPNVVDAAICTLDVEMSDEVLDIGKLGPPTSVSIGDVVVKSGRTTSITKNTVLALDGVVMVEGWGKAKFIDQIIVNQPFVEGGDSGSICCTTDNRVVGIVFAGSDVVGVVNKASNIERLLNISFTPTPTPAPTIPSLPFSLFGLAAGFGMVISSSFLKYKA